MRYAIVAIAAMHDNIYSKEIEEFKNEDIFDVVCKDKIK